MKEVKKDSDKSCTLPIQTSAAARPVPPRLVFVHARIHVCLKMEGKKKKGGC